jgi:glutamate/tyrosine decarboxylase-like PLP-dependent enzyme
MYMPYEIGCILVRHEEDQRETFALTPAYLAHGEGERGMTGGDLPWFSDYGFQLSRGFRALKAWMSFKEYGAYKYGRLIAQNIAQARYLAEKIEAAPKLELVAPVMLNTVCFRYVRPGLDDHVLDELNKRIEVELQERGVAVLSVTTVRDMRVLHAGITNHRSRREDFDLLVREVIRIGDELS